MRYGHAVQTSSYRRRADVAVVGAGATGAACAAFLAESGFDVVCVERRGLEAAGARWVNGVPRAAFAAAGVALPEAPEHLGGPAPFQMVLASRPEAGAAHTIVDHDVIHVDMRLLVARLQARARRAGVRFLERVSARGVTRGDGAVTLATEDDALTARWLIDASGLAGARLLEQPEVARGDLCAAAQQVHEIIDEAGALAYLARHRAGPGQAIGFVGVAGGFSVLNVYVEPELRTVSVLTGSIPALGFPSGKALLERFVREQPWIGAARFGGSAAIPLRRPYSRLCDGQVALLGDAGCQVFSAHGSGVGAGLIAARTLADTLAGGGSLRQWEVAWQRRHGSLLGAFDVLRRFTQTLDEREVALLFDSGMMEPELMKAGLNQEEPALSWRTVSGHAGKLARLFATEPRLTARLGSALARSRAMAALYRFYPEDERRVAAWSRAVDRLLAG